MKPHLLLALECLCFSACRKSDNPRVPELEKVPIPQITAKEGTATIPGDAPETYTVVVTVGLYFADGIKPKYFDLVVIKNGDITNPKVVQANISTFPTDVTITGQQLIDLFGEAIDFGDEFELGADLVTVLDNRYQAFPLVGAAYSAGVNALPGASPQLRLTAVCKFNPGAYTEGSYEVVTDEWEDYKVGSDVTVTKIDSTHYSFLYKASNAQPIVMEVNPADNSITVEPVMYGNYDGINFTATGVAGSRVDPCTVSFIVRLNHNAEGYGDQGNNTIHLRKK